MQHAMNMQQYTAQKGPVQQNIEQQTAAQNTAADIEEYFFNGYCKAKNQTNLVTCEYTMEPCGLCLERILGCDYLECQYNKDCDIVKKALAKEDE